MSASNPDNSSTIKVASDITPENVREAIPVYKTIGLDRTALLADVDPHVWTCIIPDLLDWTCDPNWPSTQVILPILRSNAITIRATIPLVTEILDATGPDNQGRDAEHQNTLIWGFVNELDMEYKMMMLETLKKFRENVSDELESEWELREAVGELIEEIEDAASQAGSPTVQRIERQDGV